MPTALRALRPASPKTSMNNSEQPSITPGVLLKPGRTVDHAQQLHHLDDLVERSELRVQRGQQLQTDQAGGSASGREVEGIPHLSGHQAAIGSDGAGAGEEHEIPDTHRAAVQTGGGHRGGELDSELVEACLC